METKEKIQWKVDGMDCATCALTINKYLNKEGASDVRVNFATGDVSFEMNQQSTLENITTGLANLGYKVVGKKHEASHTDAHDHEHEEGGFLKNNAQRFWFCLPFTLVLMLHMIPAMHHSWIMQPLVQLALCLPVFVVGLVYFGTSAWKSIRNGMPNMNVLIAIGATAAFVYSLYGIFTGQVDYVFFETAATVITLVFLGNYVEERTVASTQSQLKKLAQTQVIMANMIAYDKEYNENVFPVESTALRSGDLILIKSGEQVPADCKILWGDVHANEAIITGESVPVNKQQKDILIGGSIITDGTAKAQVTAVGKDTVLSGIVNLVKEAQGEKPPVQQMADKISAVFIPIVLGIALLTLIVNWLILHEFTPSLMRAIAVLVIACPCAMGLATPAAIAVGLARGARNGILFRNATSLENFKNIKQVVFDKTGTLTTGQFAINSYQIMDNRMDDTSFKNLVYSLEKYSNHPIAKAFNKGWKTKTEIRWQKVEEIKGEGMKATDKEGNLYQAGAYKIAAHLTQDDTHNIYVLENGKLVGFIDVADELRPEAKQVIQYFKAKNIKTVLLSGDKKSKADHIGAVLGMDEVISEKTPEEKLQIIDQKNKEIPTAMVGDGINDAPALAKATIGISMSDASHLAMQTAQVVLMNNGLTNLPKALGLGKHTYGTIKGNLFWAFSYNIIAIPVAALGLLTPQLGALVMAFSDVVLALNSGRLAIKKVD
ncbi:MAG TPA: cation-translocating P-type ATPase [Niabella sp.]|nr:cation-translocating P-type ATPase [Niabella sp.]HOZ96736.1 cation-translocating P-type ATPase [Niabella sp.]HQW14787.1 cation-translocating P-type ATPase [Niabella sp.]HQX19961.1 cation-translocating P-type ATPase [Niabella sp.]HQX42207.1 cation-translocating P-type ATPase [Niabella sp.]